MLYEIYCFVSGTSNIKTHNKEKEIYEIKKFFTKIKYGFESKHKKRYVILMRY